MATPHIESKKEDIAKYILMPGDPKRAKYIAENYLEDVKIINTVRGMIAYTGCYKGIKITVFPSGMGIPSMGIYSYELMNIYDAEVIIRVGTMGAYTEDLQLYDIVIADSVYSNSNYSVELMNEKIPVVKANEELVKAASANTYKLDFPVKKGRVQSTEAFYGEVDFEKMREEHDILGVEMETYSLYLNAQKYNKKALSILTVSDSFIYKEVLSSDERERNVDAMVVLALETIAGL